MVRAEPGLVGPRGRGRVRLGFVGCGRATSQLHLPALQHVPDIEVTTLADVDRERLEAVAARYDIAARHTDYARLLAEPSIDAVAVCVPPRHHVEVALAVLDSDKHLFVEKPLGLSLAECDRLVDRAARSERKAQVGLNLRQHRFVREGRRILRRGELGTIDSLRSAFTAATRLRLELPAWRDRRRLGGGVLTEIATHHFDLWRFLLGSEVEEVFAASRGDRTEDESAAVTARMSDGTVVSGMFTERSYGSNELEVFGTESWLHLDLYRFDGLHRAPALAHSGDVPARLGRTWNTLRRLPEAISGRRRGGELLTTYRKQWQAFADAIRDDAPIAATLEDGRAAASVALAAVQSATTGRPARVAGSCP